VRRGLASRDDADLRAAADVTEDEEPTERVYAKGETTRLGRMVVIAGCCERVEENRCSVGKVDAVFPEVGRGLRGIPFVLHGVSICTHVHGSQELRLRGLTVLRQRGVEGIDSGK
jgi:hypothetical protein